MTCFSLLKILSWLQHTLTHIQVPHPDIFLSSWLSLQPHLWPLSIHFKMILNFLLYSALTKSFYSHIYICMFLQVFLYSACSVLISCLFCLIPARLSRFMLSVICFASLPCLPERKLPGILRDPSVRHLLCVAVVCWLVFPTSLWSAQSQGLCYTMSFCFFIFWHRVCI